MMLYHGSNQDIVEVDLLKGMSFKDFGRGFYLTPDYDTACRMAKKKARMLKGVPTVIEYELDETVLEDGSLTVLRFPEKATGSFCRWKSRPKSISGTSLL